MNWLFSKGAVVDDLAANFAALHNDKELLIWMCSVAGIKQYTAEIVLSAVRGGHTHMVRWLIDEEHAPCENLIFAAASIGHVELLKYLVTKPGNELSSIVMQSAARSGRIEAMEWLRAQIPPCPWHIHTSSAAAQSGNMCALQWLIDQGCPVDELTTMMCAGGGHLDFLKYLHDPPMNIPIPSNSVSHAARGGHLHVLRYLVESCGCVADNDTVQCGLAASARSLPCLQYLRAHNYRWNANTCKNASIAGALELLKWACDNGCQFDVVECMLAAAQGGQLSIVAFLHETLHVPFPSNIRDIVASRHYMRLLRWLDAHHAPRDARSSPRSHARLDAKSKAYLHETLHVSFPLLVWKPKKCCLLIFCPLTLFILTLLNASNNECF